jgi:hypothetical protein
MIVRVFFDVDMRKGPNGLRELLQDKRVAVSSMKDADFFMFLNRKKNSFKILSGEGYCLHFSCGRAVTRDDIAKIPSLFQNCVAKGKNLDKLSELVDRDTKTYADGDLKHVS